MMEEARRRGELAGLLSVGIAPFYLNGLYNPPLAATHRPWFWAVEVATWILLPTVLLLVGRRRGLYDAADLGLTTRVRGRERPLAIWLLVGVVSLIFLWLSVTVAQWAHARLPAGWPLPQFDYADVVPPPGPHAGGWRLLALVELSVTAGVVEELYYRAAMDRLFPKGRLAGVAYVVSSSVIFAGVHWEGGLPTVAMAFAVGIFAAVVFRLTRNLWPLIVGHIMTDWYWLSGGPVAG